MAKLPRMIYGSGKRERLQVTFGGYRHTENCTDGEFYDMKNMSCEHYPVLATRRKRMTMDATTEKIDTFFADNGVLITVCDDTLYYDGMALAKLNPQSKRRSFVRFGDRCILMPDRTVLNTKYHILGIRQGVELLPDYPRLNDAYAVGDDQTLQELHIYVYDGTKWVDNGLFCQPMQVQITVDSAEDAATVTVLDGVIDGESAKANSISLNTGTDLRTIFKAGDGVTISGMTVMPNNNKRAIIREVEEHVLRFTDYCFKMPKLDGLAVSEYDEVGVIRIEREVPQMDGCFAHENRLWGFCGGEIFASKLGDPCNFFVFDGLSTDSYYLDTQLQGDFTAGISYGGYPVFFRENGIMKIYGSKPSTYQSQTERLPGVRASQSSSLTDVGGCLFYLSNEGFMAYNGSCKSLESVFGTQKYSAAVAGSDGRRCYISCSDEAGDKHLFCYDSVIGLWMREDETEVSAFAYDGTLYALAATDDGKHQIMTLGERGGNIHAQWNDEECFDSFVEFGDQVEDSVSRKTLVKITLRVHVEQGATLRVKLRHDHGEWITVQDILPGGKRTVQLCIKPQRCDHYNIRLESSGDWKLYAMEKEYYIGSAIH